MMSPLNSLGRWVFLLVSAFFRPVLARVLAPIIPTLISRALVLWRWM